MNNPDRDLEIGFGIFLLCLIAVIGIIGAVIYMVVHFLGW
jgi:hypothetical protein